MIKNFRNAKGHQNRISGSKITAILLKGWIFAYWWSFNGVDLHLQPAQQTCFYSIRKTITILNRLGTRVAGEVETELRSGQRLFDQWFLFNFCVYFQVALD